MNNNFYNLFSEFFKKKTHFEKIFSNSRKIFSLKIIYVKNNKSLKNYFVKSILKTEENKINSGGPLNFMGPNQKISCRWKLKPFQHGQAS